MDRRLLVASGLSLVAGAAFAQAPPPPPRPAPPPAPDDALSAPDHGPAYPAAPYAETYSRDEVLNAASDFFGVGVEAVATVIEKAFKDNGQPTGYISGEEASAAIGVGLRYGKGLLYMKNRPTQTVYWQGPSVGWDLGGNASRVFTLAYGIEVPNEIYQRFPGVEGTAYVLGGFGVNYQRAETITLAPIRAGVGLRLGANIGYLAYTRQRNLFPF